MADATCSKLDCTQLYTSCREQLHVLLAVFGCFMLFPCIDLVQRRHRYIQKDTRWRNKQRSLVFLQVGGVTARQGRARSSF